MELSEFGVDTHTLAPPHVGFGGWGRERAFTAMGTASSRTLRVTLEELTSQSLRHQYTTELDSDWQKFTYTRLQRWTEIETYKMDRERRPAGFPDSPLSSDFEVPATWDFADDQIPIWYESFCSQEECQQPDLASWAVSGL